MIQYAIYSDSGALLADYTHKATGVKLSTNTRGYADCAANIPLQMPEAFAWYDQPGLPRVRLTDNGLTVWDGRLEDPGITGTGLSAGALGYSRALSDLPDTAFWSTTQFNQFRAITLNDRALSRPEKFDINTTAQAMISLRKNEAYTNGTTNGRAGMQIPDGNSRAILGIQFDFEINLPTQYTAQLVSFSGGYGGTPTVEWTLAGTGAQVNGSIHLLNTSADAIFFQVTPNANNTYLGETGDKYLKITNLRMVSRLNNRINVTFTANRAAGAGVTATVTSTARMYAGQRLRISNAAGTVNESVLVTSVTNSTQFVATFVNGYVTNDLVQAFVIYADEIAQHLVVNVVNATNPTQLDSSTALIQSPGLDLTDESFEDQYPASIMDYLADRGDTQTPPRRWEWAVWDNQRLVFQPQGQGQTWYVDITDLEVVRTLETFFDSVYATYQDANNRTLRTPINTYSFSVTKYGLTRRQAAPASTTVLVQANAHRDTILKDQQDPLPQARIAFDAVYDSSGGRRLLHEVRAGDTFVIRNLPPTLSTSIDRIRTFRLTRTELDLDTGVLTVEPEAPLPSLEQQLAVTVGGS